MSVIVMGMQMPHSCQDCDYARMTPLSRDFECTCPGNRGTDVCDCIKNKTRHKGCPLVGLPEKHGRLIDASCLKETLDYYIAEAGWGLGVNEVLEWVKEFIDAEPAIADKEET